MNLTISASTNRITARRTNNCTDAPNLSVGHDAAGNMTSEPGRTYQYDAENRIKSVNNGSVAVYQYDADGRRSVKNSASGTRIYFYDIEGRPVAESGPTQGGWLSGHAWFQDRHVFENTGSQFLWRHTDHLGTSVVRTDSNGGKVCDSRFYPYGEEFTASCAGDPYKFTGKERDSETGLDYFGARYYGNHYGRFTSVDPALESAFAIDPQSWNRYSYVLNHPLIYVDPDGRSPVLAAALIPGPQQAITVPVAIGVGVGLGIAIVYDNRQEIGGAITGIVEGIGELFRTPGVESTELDRSPFQSDSTNIPVKTFPGMGGRGEIRVEVEVPGTRPGQIQVQRGTGKATDTLIYDPRTGELRERPGNNPSEQNRITNRELKRLREDAGFKRALDKARKVLDELERSRGPEN